MKAQNFTVVRYDAEDGKVFDWANLEDHLTFNEEEQIYVQEHLYAKTLFLSMTDDIANYVEVVAE